MNYRNESAAENYRQEMQSNNSMKICQQTIKTNDGKFIVSKITDVWTVM